MILRYACFKGIGLFSRAIRFWTRSDYSHIGYLTQGYGNEILIECWTNNILKPARWDFANPAFKNHKDGTVVEIWALEVEDLIYERVDRFMRNLARVKAKYDYLALFGFVFKWKNQSNGKYLCSEGAIAPLVEVMNWYKIKPSQVSPGDFVRLIQVAGGCLERKGVVKYGVLETRD